MSIVAEDEMFTANSGTSPLPGMSLWLTPDQLTPSEANAKARPTERPEDRARRVDLMAHSISKNGQLVPVIIVEIEDVADDNSPFVRYEYVDGGCRVEALAKLNEAGTDIQPVWCTVAAPDSDIFKSAVLSNMHRTQNSLLDVAYIITETRERNGWTNRGGAIKAAEFLGLPKSRISEYEKIMRAPKAVIDRIHSGEIVGLDAAIKLIAVEKENQEEVARRAKELAQQEKNRKLIEAEEQAARAEVGELTTEDEDDFLDSSTPVDPESQDHSTPALMLNSGDDGGMSEVLGTADAATEVLPNEDPGGAYTAYDQDSMGDEPVKVTKPAKAEPVHVTARHITQATREICTEASKLKRSRQDILDWFTATYKSEADGSAAKEFVGYLIGTWAVGSGTDKQMFALWEKMTHFSLDKAFLVVDKIESVETGVEKELKAVKAVKNAVKKATKKAKATSAKPAKKGKK